MSLQILINNSSDPRAAYIGWAPKPCRITSTDTVNRTVVLRNRNPGTRNLGTGGQVVFMTSVTGPPQDELPLTVPANSSNVSFFIAGKFDRTTGRGFPSTNDRDAEISIINSSTSAEIGTKALMVRVRKNANSLSAGERDRFLSALVRLNNQPKFLDFQNMHTTAASAEIHKRACFLPWHRGYLLDLERRLQVIDASVALPYWKFDAPAPNVFTRDFMGIPDGTGLVDFTNTNPLISWTLRIFGEGNGRIRRIPSFNTSTQKASEVQNSENATLALGSGRRGIYSDFRNNMEADPHGAAHRSFEGQIGAIGRAPADPLFFMLHTNIDRLWAKWQWITSGNRYDPADSNAYNRQGSGNPRLGSHEGIGNYTLDTMWPWNGELGRPRPPVAPGGPYPASPLTVSAPGDTPQVRSMIDFQGQRTRASELGFAYDDVPFDF